MHARLRVCVVAGCGQLTTRARCSTHALPARGTQHRRVRAHVLAEENTCWLCGKPGTDVGPLTRAHGGPTTRANGRGRPPLLQLELRGTRTGGVDRRVRRSTPRQLSARETFAMRR